MSPTTLSIIRVLDVVHCLKMYKLSAVFQGRDKWVPIAMECGVLRVQMEERPPIWRVAANILN